MAIPLNLDPQRPTQRDRGLLLDTIPEIPDSAFDSPSDIARIWMEGVTWAPWGTDGLDTLESTCASTYNKTSGEVPDYVTQPAFLLYDSLACSTLGLSFATLAGRVRRNLEVMASAAFAAELETGAVSGGHALVDGSTINATAAELHRALHDLEQHLADTLHGATGMIHLTPGLLAIAPGIAWRDGAYRTRTGHVVVGDAGHSGTPGPTGQSDASASQSWVYATGPVFYRQGPIKGLTGIEEGNSEIYIPTNTNRPLGETFGVVVFDPDTVGAALVDIDLATSDA